jgi:hypothetical protein
MSPGRLQTLGPCAGMDPGRPQTLEIRADLCPALA